MSVVNNNPADYALVLYKSNQCGYCTKITKIWEDLTDIHKVTVTSLVREHFPAIKIVPPVVAVDNSGKFDEKKYPKGVLDYSKWFPMILMVPGQLWRQAMSQVEKAPEIKIELIEGVHILNGKWNGQILTHEQKYNIMDPEEIFKWISSVISEKSKELSGMTKSNSFDNLDLDSTELKNNPILKPVYSMIKAQETQNNTNNKESKQKDFNPNLCGQLRIIPRPPK